jgi:4-hydroxybenzoate polyprenyltransferase
MLRLSRCRTRPDAFHALQTRFTRNAYAPGVGRSSLGLCLRVASSAAARDGVPAPPSPTPSLPAPRTWVDALPARARPYAYLTRIDKPIGTLLLFYPCAWGITLAAHAVHAPPATALAYIGLFGTGALVMRGAGCTINDLWDRNLDKAVGARTVLPLRAQRLNLARAERTKDRPLARGDITPTQAIAFLAVQLSAGLGVLTQLNWYRYGAPPPPAYLA